MTEGHPTNPNHNGASANIVNEDFTSEEWASSLANLSTPLLNSKLTFLKSQSSTLSSTLTAKLASSPSGQSLLHIGPSLSTLPPDLLSLLSSLEPMLDSVRAYEQEQQKELVRIVTSGKLIQRECRRAIHARDCTQVLKDLVAVEQILETDMSMAMKVRVWERDQGRDRVRDWENVDSSDRDYNGDETEDTHTDQDRKGTKKNTYTNTYDDGTILQEELDHMASLERVAHATLHLMHQLQSSSEQVTTTLKSKNNVNGNSNDNDKDDANAASSSSKSKEMQLKLQLPSMNTPLPHDTEKAQFVMRLAPRIRALEKNAIKSILKHLERVLKRRLNVRNAKEERERERQSDTGDSGGDRDGDSDRNNNNENDTTCTQREEDERLLLGHLLRSFALLGRGSDAESMFANVAIMPIVKKKMSIGKLDEGGSRGECAGLYPLLQEIVLDVRDLWGDVLQLVECIFDTNMDIMNQGDGEYHHGHEIQIDLVTAGVWVPIATALMTDPSIKMAIFSPGIANIFQANYSALDTFLAKLASSLLKSSSSSSLSGERNDNDTNAATATAASFAASDDEDKLALTQLYYQPEIDRRMITMAQNRIYAHSTTLEFSKKWNLPIYYQLRFGEVCARLEKAIQQVQVDGWHAPVYSGADTDMETHGVQFELPFFHELFDALRWLWGPDVFLRPLTHRFLRGTIQVLGRIVSFINDGLKGEIKFGVDPNPTIADETTLGGGEDDSANAGITTMSKPLATVDRSYSWNERIEDVATVSWELTVLERYLTSEHVAKVADTVSQGSTADGEVRTLISEVMTEAAQDIPPVVEEIWNDIIVNILISKCSSPLGAVKGVAATYRMTNRPPPTQASPFVATILRPLKEFDSSFSNHIPPTIGDAWKKNIVDTIAERYATAISELIETVQRTEEALKNRKVRRAAAGGMSDGEKVRLQLFLDQRAFAKSVEEVGIDASLVNGMQRLITLTQAAEELYLKTLS